ncbi:microtubule-associated serine/threonine-protein kinase 2-like isoform X3 [Dermacentor variabilis]|uniref:microtubule-associated serine/threonine-protein kinase 2-like isoform X3 n=1 Tax=Dermacentor variabilis TaxID=34621 RepID=UPI003F5B71BA
MRARSFVFLRSARQNFFLCGDGASPKEEENRTLAAAFAPGHSFRPVPPLHTSSRSRALRLSFLYLSCFCLSHLFEFGEDRSETRCFLDVFWDIPASHAMAEKSLVEKGKQAAKTITTLFPRIPKTCTTLLEVFIKRESKVSLLRDPLTHFCEEELVLHAQECLLKINKQVVTYQDIRSMAENLIGLHTLCIKRDPDVARTQGENMRKLIIIVGELAGSLERMCDVPVTDWVAIADSLMGRMEKLNLPKTLPFATYIPKIRDFENVRMLGAGGFGAVYLARYKPVGFEASLKLVNMDRFSRHKQAAMDKVVASVIRNPFLVKYYSCYCVKEAYVTIMEFIPGLDLQRVVTKAEYLKIDAVQIIMAQLILAIEHMHLHGFLHRDIKVSNMLIMPGGRVKVIDFDTTKVCHGHFSKRVLRHYFKRTAFEFNDSESAGTIPYMAPEILKRRPYGRSVDWWSSGIVMYKLMTGKVPFRGKTKQMLRERIITAPLKWPRATDTHGHSATTPAKDMTYRMLRKNPAERLGSRIYSDLKTHSFFDGFNWKQLYTKKDLIDIPAIKLKEKHGKVNADMMDTSGNESSELHYDQPKRNQSIPDASDNRDALEKVDLLLFRKKKFYKFWGYGFSLRRSKGEDDSYYIYVDTVTADSPADKSTVLPLDVVLYVNGKSVMNESLSKARKLIARTGDTMVLSVMSCSSYRLLTTRRDMFSIMRSVPKEQRADVNVSGKGSLYPGDVVTAVDSTALETLTIEQVMQMLGMGKAEVSLSVVPLSPMRASRFVISKLQEQTITDGSVPTRSTRASETNL